MFFSSPLPLFGLGAGAGDVFEAVGALEGEHPAGVFGRESAYFVQLSDLDCGELEIDCGEVVLKLVQALGSDDHGCDDGFCQ